MKDNGFTLVELLGVLIILGIIFTLVFTNVSDIISQAKDVTSQTQINNILLATYNYSLKNNNILPDKNNKYFVTLAELKNEGLLDFNITNPESGELYPDNLVISINNVGSGTKNKNNNSIMKGNYLYTIEFDSLNKFSYLPRISLSGLTKNASGNYVVTLNLNSSYTDYTYSAIDYMNIDITDRVKVNKYFNNNKVEDIDTSKPGLYKVTYTALDNAGYASVVTLSVIIADNEAPNIILESSSKISRSLNYFNLMEGVSCTDNSEICEVSYTGTINYGTPGKYVIEYSAQDPNGNTSTKKRVITIE